MNKSTFFFVQNLYLQRRYPRYGLVQKNQMSRKQTTYTSTTSLNQLLHILLMDGLLIVNMVYGIKVPGILLVIFAVIGIVIAIQLYRQLVLLLKELDVLSLISETVIMLELFTFHWMELRQHQHLKTLLARRWRLISMMDPF